MLHSITCQHVKVKPRNPATPEPQEAKQEEAAAKHEAKAPAVFGEVKGANGGSSSASPGKPVKHAKPSSKQGRMLPEARAVLLGVVAEDSSVKSKVQSTKQRHQSETQTSAGCRGSGT